MSSPNFEAYRRPTVNKNKMETFKPPRQFVQHPHYSRARQEALAALDLAAIDASAVKPGVVAATTGQAAYRYIDASITAALATYAQTHEGHYPGVALDVMAPFNDHALGDPAAAGGPAGPRLLRQGGTPGPGGDEALVKTWFVRQRLPVMQCPSEITDNVMYLL